MKISIFGMGYVGTVSVGCLAQDGHQVVGVDPVRTKVDRINAGQSPDIEAGHRRDRGRHRQAGRERQATRTKVSGETELSFVRAARRARRNGNLDPTYIRRVCELIGEALKNKSARHTIVIRSTILPCTMHQIVIPIRKGSRAKRPAATSVFAIIQDSWREDRR